MASTIKAVRRNKGSCICKDTEIRFKNYEFSEGTCRYGYCGVLRCLSCFGEMCSWGPVACKCDGGPRWARHLGMQQPRWYNPEKDEFYPRRAFVKPSLLRRGSHRNR